MYVRDCETSAIQRPEGAMAQWVGFVTMSMMGVGHWTVEVKVLSQTATEGRSRPVMGQRESGRMRLAMKVVRFERSLAAH